MAEKRDRNRTTETKTQRQKQKDKQTDREIEPELVRDRDLYRLKSRLDFLLYQLLTHSVTHGVKEWILVGPEN